MPSQPSCAVFQRRADSRIFPKTKASGRFDRQLVGLAAMSRCQDGAFGANTWSHRVVKGVEVTCSLVFRLRNARSLHSIGCADALQTASRFRHMLATIAASAGRTAPSNRICGGKTREKGNPCEKKKNGADHSMLVAGHRWRALQNRVPVAVVRARM